MSRLLPAFALSLLLPACQPQDDDTDPSPLDGQVDQSVASDDAAVADQGAGGADQGTGIEPPRAFVVASYNVQNLFDMIDDPDTDENEFTPGSHWTASLLETRLDRMAQMITTIDADVIAINEAENLEILERLRDEVRDAGGPDYPYLALAEGREGLARGIDVSLMSRYPLICSAIPGSTGCPRPINYEFTCEGEDGEMQVDGNNYSEARPILQSEVDFDEDGVGDVIFLVNHWKAKSTDSWPCLDSNDNHRRAAMQHREVVDQLIAADPTRPIVILGDFNSYEFEPALAIDLEATLDADTLNAANDVYNVWGEAGVTMHDSNSNSWNNVSNSTYNYYGRWSRLDHIFVTGNMRADGEARWRVTSGSTSSVAPAYALDGGEPASFSVYTGDGYSDHLPVRVEFHRDY